MFLLGMISLILIINKLVFSDSEQYYAYSDSETCSESDSDSDFN